MFTIVGEGSVVAERSVGEHRRTKQRRRRGGYMTCPEIGTNPLLCQGTQRNTREWVTALDPSGTLVSVQVQVFYLPTNIREHQTPINLHEPPPRIPMGQGARHTSSLGWDRRPCWQLQVGLEDSSDVCVEVPAVEMLRVAWMEDKQKGLAVEAARRQEKRWQNSRG